VITVEPLLPRRLEIGGHPAPVPGFEQLPAGVRWGTDRLPYPDGTFAEVYSSHVIEHVPWWLTQAAITEAVRVLEPGGLLEIHTVDFGYLVRCYQARDAGDGWQARGKNPHLHPIRWLASRLYSVDEDLGGDNWHRAVFDWPYLVELLSGAGLAGIDRAWEPRGREKHGAINIGIRGRKPA